MTEMTAEAKEIRKRSRRVAAFFRKETAGPYCKIETATDMEYWQQSKAYVILISYLFDVSSLIQGVRTTDPFPVSRSIKRLLTIFDALEALIVANPPVASSAIDPKSSLTDSGNRSFRKWARCMLRDIYYMVEKAVPKKKCQHVNELGFYLSASFGNSTKIEYGPSHELNFLFFVCSLFQAHILSKQEDLAASGLVLFDRYLKLVRRLQVTYSMAPPPNHGPYSLDKFQFLPFVWGAAQLCYDAPFSPRKMLDEDIVALHKGSYLLIDCVAHIMMTNIGSFACHSSQLWCLASLSQWTDIYRGLVFRYTEDIVVDFELIQPMRFGTLMPFDMEKSKEPVAAVRLGVLSPVRVQIDEALDHSSTSTKPETEEAADKSHDKKYDSLSNSGMSLGSHSTSLSDVSVHLPNWLEAEEGSSH
ncbi:serine/threonine-protein phosphatase 2A activator [Drosophila bipectinata]|uniref:serine/threonine-protein phosphatase 2A activator n=1 Tax=Drosophila bipectinata TaxID=42026 RepID=UPI001C8A53BC|nr:serine/threonine-protein phosphatase 2A activator [Drosophila bipectinata]